jgi:hypothetical protein
MALYTCLDLLMDPGIYATYGKVLDLSTKHIMKQLQMIATTIIQ